MRCQHEDGIWFPPDRSGKLGTMEIAQQCKALTGGGSEEWERLPFLQETGLAQCPPALMAHIHRNVHGAGTLTP